MSETPNQSAQGAVNHVEEDKTAEFILALASERARGQHAASIALDQRITQAGALLFTAAALAGTFAAAGGGNQAMKTLSAMSAILFIVGAVQCFRGIRSDEHHPPGLPPAWWAGVIDHENFPHRSALCWAAGAIQDMIDANALEDDRRAQRLNLGLKFAAWGAGLIALAVSLKLFES